MAPVAALSIEMRAEFDKLNADLKKIERSFGSFQKRTQKQFQSLGNAVSLAVGAVVIAGVYKLTEAFMRLGAEGERTSSIAESFEKLGGKSSVIDEARTSVVGLVSAFDLMAVANKGLVAGVAGFQESFTKIADLGGRVANAFGKDTKTSIEELTESIIKGNAKGLIPLGFSFSDTSDKALVTTEALEQLSTVMERFNKVGDSTFNALDSIRITFNDLLVKVWQGVNANAELTASLREFERELKKIDLAQFSNDLATIAKQLVELATTILPYVVTGLRNFATYIKAVKGELPEAEIIAINSELEKMRRQLEHLKGKSKIWGTVIGSPEEIAATEKRIKELEALLINAGNRLNKTMAGESISVAEAIKPFERIIKEKEEKEKKSKKKVHDYSVDLMEKEAREWESKMKDATDGIASALSDAFGKVGGGELGQVFDTISKEFPDLYKDVLIGLSKELDVAAEAIAQMIEGFVVTLGAIFEAGKINKKTGSEAGTGGAIGAAIGSIWGDAGAKIGNVIGQMIGKTFKWGASDPQTKARVAFEQFLEDAFKSLRVRFFGQDGKLGGFFSGNFVGKGLTGDFSSSNWAKSMDAWGKGAAGAFLGLGEAMKEMQGITEDVGAQLGYILGKNLMGNLDNAKILVAELGLTFEQVSEALLKSALKGTISWAEFNRYIAETGEAFKPGLAAVGAISEAFQNLIDSAGQGRNATKSFKDVAVEALQAGVTTMEGLRNYLATKGFDPEYISALFQAAAQRNIKDLKSWASASDEVAGAVVGDMEAMSEKLREAWSGMRDSLKEMADGLAKIPSKVKTDVSVSVTTKYDDKTKALVETLGRSTLPDGIPLPDTRTISNQVTASTSRGARSSATQNNSNASTPGAINIDARGASPGVDQQIMRAAAYIENKVLNRVYSTLQDSRTRGGRAEGAF
ncbi:hypothetical protein EKK58_02040 [Candidatus Dependentiae bacterium]|nr:MAG: hypothetical protein EKK58_02040 [Candidatus Dependentiae bacterium]